MINWFSSKKKFVASDDIEQKEIKPFDKREKISSLSMVVTIVNRDQSNYYISAYQEAGASMSLVLYSYSMPPQEYRAILGADSTKKDMLLTVCREDQVKTLLGIAKKRFMISDAAKGIAFACPIDAVGGISVYKFLADQNKELRENNNGKRK